MNVSDDFFYDEKAMLCITASIETIVNETFMFTLSFDFEQYITIRSLCQGF
ncbi:MAG: hypothetical protein ACI4U2_04710 [Christensenellaceae bacterium]